MSVDDCGAANAGRIDDFPRVVERPTMADAQDAASALLASVAQVPFAAPSDRAAWLAMVLTPLARYAIGGASPLCIVEDAARSRWSEALITDLASIVGAAPPAVIDADDLLPSPRRSIDVLRANGESVARITNGSTRPTMAWRRIHEALQRARATSGFVWVASTTRPTRDFELSQYALTVRCEGGDADRYGGEPSSRDPSGTNLLSAALTILRAYQAAGRPDVRLVRWAGFERWSAVVRAAVVWIGLPDPVMSSARLSETTDVANATDASVADLIVGWSELATDFPGGCSARQALDALNRAPGEKYRRLRAAVTVFAPGPLNDPGTAERLGRSLRRCRDATPEGHALVHTGSGNQGNRWAVRAPASASSAHRQAPPTDDPFPMPFRTDG